MQLVKSVRKVPHRRTHFSWAVAIKNMSNLVYLVSEAAWLHHYIMSAAAWLRHTKFPRLPGSVLNFKLPNFHDKH